MLIWLNWLISDQNKLLDFWRKLIASLFANLFHNWFISIFFNWWLGKAVCHSSWGLLLNIPGTLCWTMKTETLRFRTVCFALMQIKITNIILMKCIFHVCNWLFEYNSLFILSLWLKDLMFLSKGWVKVMR